MELLYELIYVMLMNILESSAVMLILYKLHKHIFVKKSQLITVIAILSIVSVVMLVMNIPLKEIAVPIVLIFCLKWTSELSSKKIITLFVLCMTYIMIVQIGLTSLLKAIGILENTYFIALTCNTMLVVIALFTYQYIPLNRVESLLERFESIIFWLIALIGVPLILYFIAWKIDYSSINYISLIVVGIILWTGIVAIIFKELFQIKEKQKANEIYMEYNPMLENLISDVKAKQHDIKNQLHAIYGIAERKGDGELTTYLQSIIDGYQFHDDDDLLNTGSNIVSSILYSKKIKAKNNDIKLEVNCQSPFPDYPVEDFEFVDILGNLLDNAIEATNQKENLPYKSINISLQKDNLHNVIEVKNTSDPMSIDLLSKIFDKGYSTKGNNRGFGLYNVKKIVNAHDGQIEVFYDENQVCFRIVFGY